MVAVLVAAKDVEQTRRGGSTDLLRFSLIKFKFKIFPLKQHGIIIMYEILQSFTRITGRSC